MQHKKNNVQDAVRAAFNSNTDDDFNQVSGNRLRTYPFLSESKPKSGRYIGRLSSYIDLGRQPDPIKGYAQCSQRIMLTWELIGAGSRPSGQPHTVSAYFTLSMHPKSKLRKLIEDWLGCGLKHSEAKNLRVADFVGEYGMADVTAAGNFFVLDGMSPCADDLQVPSTVNDVLVFDLLSSDESVFNRLTPKVRAMIEKSVEWVEAKAEIDLAATQDSTSGSVNA